MTAALVPEGAALPGRKHDRHHTAFHFNRVLYAFLPCHPLSDRAFKAVSVKQFKAGGPNIFHPGRAVSVFALQRVVDTYSAHQPPLRRASSL